MEFGWFGNEDVGAAVDYLLTRPDVVPTRIGAVGMSIGGEEVLGAMAADPRIRVAVAEGATNRAFADKRWLSHAYGLRGDLQLGVDWLTYRLTDLLTSAPPPISLADAVRAAAPRPVLLIAADARRRAPGRRVDSRRLAGQRRVVGGAGRRPHRRAARSAGQLDPQGVGLPRRRAAPRALSTSGYGRGRGGAHARGPDVASPVEHGQAGGGLLRTRWLARSDLGLPRTAGHPVRAAVADARAPRPQLRPARYVVLEVVDRTPGHYVVVSGFGERAQWFRNVQANPRVRIWVGSRGPRRANARWMGTEEAAHSLERYASAPARLGAARAGAPVDARRPHRRAGTNLPMVDLELDADHA